MSRCSGMRFLPSSFICWYSSPSCTVPMSWYLSASVSAIAPMPCAGGTGMSGAVLASSCSGSLAGSSVGSFVVVGIRRVLLEVADALFEHRDHLVGLDVAHEIHHPSLGVQHAHDDGVAIIGLEHDGLDLAEDFFGFVVRLHYGSCKITLSIGQRHQRGVK